jgi:hypothetical protein
VRDDAVAHLREDAVEVVDLRSLLFEIVGRGRTRGPEGIVLKERIAVEEVDFRDRGLRDQVEDVAARAAEPDDRDLAELQLLRRQGDAGPARGRVDVSERGLRVVVPHDRERPRGRVGVDRPHRSRHERDVVGHLVVVVVVAAGPDRLARQRAHGCDAGEQLLNVIVRHDLRKASAIAVVGDAVCETRNVVGRLGVASPAKSSPETSVP